MLEENKWVKKIYYLFKLTKLNYYTVNCVKLKIVHLYLVVVVVVVAVAVEVKLSSN